MDKCPECKEYTLYFDIYKKNAVCKRPVCGFTEKMTEDEYILKHVEDADLSRYTVIPTKLEKLLLQRKKYKRA